MAVLPNGIHVLLSYLAAAAAHNGNHLRKDEVDKLKADLMNSPERWAGVPVDHIQAACLALGLLPDDTSTISQLVTDRHTGRRLVPAPRYAGFRFLTLSPPPPGTGTPTRG